MTELPKPKKNRLGTPKQVEDKKTQNLKKSPANSLVRFNMLLSPELKQELKLLAVQRNMTMTDIIFEGIELWKEKHA